MRVLHIFWKAIAFFAEVGSIFGVTSFFVLNEGGSIMSALDGYIIIPLFQRASVLLVVLLIFEAPTKYPQIAGILNFDLTSIKTELLSYIRPPVKPADNELEDTPNISIAWSNPSSDEFADDLKGNFCTFTCFETPASGGYQLISGVGGGAFLDSRHGNIRLGEIQKKNRSIHKLTLTNHSDAPIFSISIPVIASCFKKNDDNYDLVHQEKSSFFGSAQESIMPGEKINFYLYNSSEQELYISLELMDHIEANLFNADNKVKIKYTWEGFRPLKIQMDYNHVDG